MAKQTKTSGSWNYGNGASLVKEKKTRAPRSNREFKEHAAALKFLALQYPKVEFFSDGSGQNVGAAAGAILSALRKSRGVSDIIIPEPTARFCGLFIEMKATGEELFQTRDRSKWLNKHTEEQAVFITKMNAKGYFATFAIGTEHAIRIINQYLRDRADLRPFPDCLPAPRALRIQALPVPEPEISGIF